MAGAETPERTGPFRGVVSRARAISLALRLVRGYRSESAQPVRENKTEAVISRALLSPPGSCGVQWRRARERLALARLMLSF